MSKQILYTNCIPMLHWDKKLIYETSSLFHDFKKYKLCIDCNEYFSFKDNIRCTVCKNTYQNKETSTFSTNLNISVFKNRLKDKKILQEIYNEISCNTHYKLLPYSQSRILINKLKTCSPTELYLTLLGFREFPPTWLWAEDVDELLLHFETEIKTQSSYVHAIAAFAFDKWRCKSTSITFLCYYNNFGEVEFIIPSSIQELIKYWSRIKLVFSDFLKNTIVTQCCVCDKDIIYNNDKLKMCIQCKKITCDNCTNSWSNSCIDNNRICNCPNCRLNWNLPASRISLK
jgi:hypothetical protein